jgi:DNA-binding beta-propeller fold protein YncE
MSWPGTRAGLTISCILSLVAGLGACGGGGHSRRGSSTRQHAAKPSGTRRAAEPHRHPLSDPVALVTAESRNELMAVDLRSGQTQRQITVPPDPENVAVGDAAVVVSTAARTVTVLDPHTLHVIAELHGFTSPHIPAIAPDGKYAYVTDDGAGTVTAIRLADAKRFPAVPVGSGAHHLSLSPDGRRLWIALGEAARTIVVLDTTNRTHPRVLRRFDPAFAVHDVVFSPAGRAVWLTAASTPDVTAVDARTAETLFRVRVGQPPQHIAFDRAGAYLTSGYGGTIEKVDPATGQILTRARSPYGSFELDAADGYTATSSLLRGTITIYNSRLQHRRIVPLASRTRDLAIVTPQP